MIVNGFHVQLVDEYRGRIIFQVATDQLTAEEFDRLWALTGNHVRAQLADRATRKEPTQVEFRLRASQVIA